MTSEKKVYTLKEVEKHNSDNDVWMVINDHVYDLTKFLNEASTIFILYRYNHDQLSLLM